MIRTGIATLKGINALRDHNLLDPCFDLGSDTALVASYKGVPIAALLARPMIWVHGLNTNIRTTGRGRAEAVNSLLQYALGWGPAAPRPVRGCLFTVDPHNDKMGLIAHNLGAVTEPGILHRLDLLGG